MEVRVGGGVVCSGGASARDPAPAALIGGNLFGRVAMRPALTEVGDKAELREGAQSGVAVPGGELVGAGDAPRAGWRGTDDIGS
jgi:hypothetical protein